MTNSINDSPFPIFESAEFLRVISYGEGKKGRFAVGIVRHDQNEYTTLFAEEEFPAAKLLLIQEGQVIKVKPSERGLRARLQDQDIKLIAQNTEDIAIEVCHLKDKVDGLENRQSERFDHLEKVVNQLKTLIVWWDEQKDE